MGAKCTHIVGHTGRHSNWGGSYITKEKQPQKITLGVRLCLVICGEVGGFTFRNSMAIGS